VVWLARLWGEGSIVGDICWNRGFALKNSQKITKKRTEYFDAENQNAFAATVYSQ